MSLRIFLLLFLLPALLGCQRTPATDSISPSPLAEVKDEQFQHSTLPKTVENLSGTALLSASTKLAAQIQQDSESGYFLLLDQGDPTRAVLIRAGNLSPEELEACQSTIVAVSGKVKSLDHPDLAKFVQENYQLELATHDGQVQWIDNVADLGLVPAEDPDGQE